MIVVLPPSPTSTLAAGVVRRSGGGATSPLGSTVNWPFKPQASSAALRPTISTLCIEGDNAFELMTSRINLSESNDFLPRAQATLAALETTLEQTFDALGLDVDIERAGGVLNIHLAKGKTVVVNLQSPMQQIWLASPFGGYHYAWDGLNWVDTRGGAPFYERLAQDLSSMAGVSVVLVG